MSFELQPELAEAVRNRQPVESAVAITYITEGGTYMIASPSKWNDDNRPHDLIAVLADNSIHVMRPTVNPEFADAIAEAVQS